MPRTPPTESQVRLHLSQDLPLVKESITSRVLVDNDILRVVQFTFDTGEQLTEHSSPRAVTCLLHEGDMTFLVDGTEHHLQAGDVVYLAPNAPHALIATSPARLTLTMVGLNQE